MKLTKPSLLALSICLYIIPPIYAQDIHQVVSEGGLARLQELIAKNSSLLKVKDPAGNTLLHTASQGGHADIIQFLLKKGIEANAQNNAGYTALHHAVLSRQKEAVEILLKHGANPNIQNVFSVTPLIMAVGDGNLDMIKLLHSQGAVIAKTDIILLHYAILNQQSQAADYLIEHGLDIPIHGKEGKVFLHNAAKMGLNKLTNLMIEKGADINSASSSGGTLLHSATYGKLSNLIKQLIKEGFNVNSQDRYGFTPLHFAALHGMNDIISLIAAQQADLSPESKSGVTPLDLAKSRQQEKTAALLLSLGAEERPLPPPLDLDKALDPDLAWTTGAAMPSFIRNMGAAVVGDKIYVMGGYGRGIEVANANFVYDTIENTWLVKAKMPTPRTNLAVVSLNNKIYALGGNTAMEINEGYEPETDTWQNLAPLPTPRMHINCSGAAIQDKIYIIGGLAKWFTISDKNEVYDPSTDSWRECAPLPTPRQGAAVVSAQGKIFVIGGNGDYPPLLLRMTIVEAYDPLTDSWERKADIPEAGIPLGVVTANNQILALTQTGFGNEEALKIYTYDPARDIWSTGSVVPRTVRLGSVTIVNNTIYIIGGGNSQKVFSDILIGKIRNKFEQLTKHQPFNKGELHSLIIFRGIPAGIRCF